MEPTRRYDSRRPINQSITPGPLVGTTEDFVIDDLSTGGMSLLRTTSVRDVADKTALDMRYAWLTIRLPGTDIHVTALTEVVHREYREATERIRVRFDEMSFKDRVTLCDYLEHRDRQVACAAGLSATSA